MCLCALGCWRNAAEGACCHPSSIMGGRVRCRPVPLPRRHAGVVACATQARPAEGFGTQPCPHGVGNTGTWRVARVGPTQVGGQHRRRTSIQGLCASMNGSTLTECLCAHQHESRLPALQQRRTSRFPGSACGRVGRARGAGCTRLPDVGSDAGPGESRELLSTVVCAPVKGGTALGRPSSRAATLCAPAEHLEGFRRSRSTQEWHRCWQQTACNSAPPEPGTQATPFSEIGEFINALC